MSALHELLSDNLSTGLADHTPNTCIVCTPEAFSEDEVSIVAMYMSLQHQETEYICVICKWKTVQMYLVTRFFGGFMSCLTLKDKIRMYNSATGKSEYM